MGTQGTSKHPGLRAEWRMSAYQSVFVNDSGEVGLRPATPQNRAMRRSAEHAPPLYAGSSYGGG